MNLYKYQEKYLSTLPNKVIMAASTGTGKTFMSLAHYEKHAKGAPLVIVAPASKVRTHDWEREIAEWWSGREAETPQFVVYSYERFSRQPSAKRKAEGERAIYEQFADRPDIAVIADECHKAKNPQSQAGGALYFVARNAKSFAGLSATALPNGWIDFANYSKIFGFVKNITEFKKIYCNIQSFKGFPEIIGYNRIRDLQTQYAQIAAPLSKAEALDLPERTFVGVDFEKPKGYTKAIVTRFSDTGEMLDNPSKLSHYLRQTLATSDKLDYLKDILSGTTDNVVIFYNYDKERDAILEMLSDKSLTGKTLFEQNGRKHELPSKADWENVYNSVTVSHYKSGSTGVEMTYANIVVYFSPTYSYAEYEQSIGRVYRNGQDKHTTFYNFRTIDTIEQDVYEVLRGKKDFQISQWAGKVLKGDN